MEILLFFNSLFESLQTLFWGTFGLVDLQTFQIYKKHTFTMFIGLLMYGVYSSIMIIVLLNMLIAMMSNTYQYIAVCRISKIGLLRNIISIYLEFN